MNMWQRWGPYWMSKHADGRRPWNNFRHNFRSICRYVHHAKRKNWYPPSWFLQNAFLNPPHHFRVGVSRKGLFRNAGRFVPVGVNDDFLIVELEEDYPFCFFASSSKASENNSPDVLFSKILWFFSSLSVSFASFIFQTADNAWKLLTNNSLYIACPSRMTAFCS